MGINKDLWTAYGSGQGAFGFTFYELTQMVKRERDVKATAKASGEDDVQDQSGVVFGFKGDVF